MSRRQEIKQKEQLQLQLQAQFNKLDQTVLSWLKPTSTPTTSTTESEFGSQIVIPSGKGINFDAPTSKEANGKGKVTIDDFMDTVGTKKKTDADGRINKIGDVKRRDGTGTSNSLRALTNKLRSDKREQSRGGHPKKAVNVRKAIVTKKEQESESESDDEILNRKSKTAKFAKTTKNKRPF